MSIVVSNCNEISKSPLNYSKSKQLFSFSKDTRFKALNPSYCLQPFYSIPDGKEKRSPSFGYGKRYEFGKGTFSPPPGAYPSKSDFDKDTRKGKTFGIAREAYSKVFLETAPLQGNTAPGPGTYNAGPQIGSDASKYTMRTRTADSFSPVLGKSSPGPGYYSDYPAVNPLGKFLFSKYRGSSATLMNPPSSKRFPDSKRQGPGPGNYEVPCSIKNDGLYFVSKFRSSGNVRFLNGSRTINSKSTSLLSPGPGSYKLPSEFGHYESKFASTLDERQWKAQTAANNNRMAQTQGPRSTGLGGSTIKSQNASRPINP